MTNKILDRRNKFKIDYLKKFRLHFIKFDVKLKECPFCGSVPELNSFEDGVFWVECSECGLETIVFDSEREAFKYWNTRFEDKTAQKN